MGQDDETQDDELGFNIKMYIKNHIVYKHSSHE